MQGPYSGFSTHQTHQSEPIPGKDMVENSAGGYSFAIDKWEAAKRFLILGSEGGTYYISERKLIKQNALSIITCAEEDGPRLVNMIVEVSESGRAPKNDPAIFALALASAFGDEKTRRLAFDSLNRVCRIGTHLFHFAQYREQFAGWGRGAKRAVAEWYERNSQKQRLSYQVIKYRRRDGWTHADLLRLSHPNSIEKLDADFILGRYEGGHVLYDAFISAQNSVSVKHTANLIREYNLPREAVPTEHLNDPLVWEALLYAGMPLTALIRNLGNMSKVGLLVPMSDTVREICARLSSGDVLRNSRVHPLQILLALDTYASGHGVRGGGTWNPVASVVNALDSAFYSSFENVEPTGKRTLIGLDVSMSMDGSYIAGTHLNCRRAATAMAMVTLAREELNAMTVAFSQGLTVIPLSSKQRLDDACNATSHLPFQGTDCALPIVAATQQNWQVDTFIIYTDNETWAGNIHPVQALHQYRQKTGNNARLIVVGMASNGFTIADPTDLGMLDVVGFDGATPQLISEFSKGF